MIENSVKLTKKIRFICVAHEKSASVFLSKIKAGTIRAKSVVIEVTENNKRNGCVE